jgi:hypothetical protein
MAQNCKTSVATYPIYEATDPVKATNLHTAAQFGNKSFIMNTLEKCLDVDVNAIVRSCPPSLFILFCS